MHETATTDACDTVRIAVSPAARHEMIPVLAYHRAERRGFAPGRGLDDWFEASGFIDRTLAEMAAAGEARPRRPELRNALRRWRLPGA